MIVKMAPTATPEEAVAVVNRLHNLGYKTGEMIGELVTLIGIYGDITQLPVEEIQQMGGVAELIPISKQYKRVAQKGAPGNLIHHDVPIGTIVVGTGRLTIIAGPCSVESEAQIMEAARMVRNAGANALRGGVVKYRSSPYSGWEGIGAGSREALQNGLRLIVKAGKEFGLPTVVEILDQNDVSLYEDAGIDCLQVGEPNSKNQALLNRLRETTLPVIHKRGNSLDIEAYLLWVERVMTSGKENVILCERGIVSANKYTRNTLDIAGITALHQLSCLPVAADPSHGTGIRDLVYHTSLACVCAGASVLLIEVHPNPLIAKSDGHQSLFPEQFDHLVLAAHTQWNAVQAMKNLYVPSSSLIKYEGRVAVDRERFSKAPYMNGGAGDQNQQSMSAVVQG